MKKAVIVALISDGVFATALVAMKGGNEACQITG
jgi:hypothetical protein